MLRWSITSSNKNNLSESADDLPSFGVEEFADLLDSVPMPARSRETLAGDNESTEEMSAAGHEDAAADAISSTGALPRRRNEPTQPIKVLGFASERLPRQDFTARETARPAANETGGRPITSAREVREGDLLAGRYVVVEQVRHRGMGLVYKALDRQREKAGSPLPWVALKFASETGGDAAEMSACLRQEFLKLSQLNHPNVVSVFDLGCHGELDFIVMEWLDGESLASIMAQITSKRIALDRAVDIIHNVARAVAHAHELGIVHGDIKPSNIFLAAGRRIKLLDFGSSAKSTADAGESDRNWATRAYASCELLQGGLPQPGDDVFALGVTAYCLLSGERPFGDLDALAARERGIAPPPLPEDAQQYEVAIMHALRLEAIDRPVNAAGFLHEFVERVAEAEEPPRPHPPSPAAAYGALAATLLASLAWWTMQGNGGLPRELKSALDSGDDALAEGRLLRPENESALEYYSTVLEAVPDNPEARQGIDRIAEQYLSRARAALEEHDLQAASAHLATAKQVNRGHFGIAVLEDLIGSRARELLADARAASGTEPERAERLLQQAVTLLPADDPTVASTRAVLAEQRAEHQLDLLLKGIDERILAERLTVPDGDSALDLLRRARAVAPHDREVKVAADRIMTALLFQAMFATSNGNFDDAARFIDTAKAMGTKHLALARAEYELAKARRQALATR